MKTGCQVEGAGQGAAAPARQTPEIPSAVVLDTSALIAVLLSEPADVACASILKSNARLLISAGTLAEALIVAGNRGIGEDMAALVTTGGVEVMPVSAAAAARVAEAYATWGEGKHPAGLNFGDCFAYSLGHVDKWRSQRRIDVMSMKPRKLSAVLS